MHNQFHNFKYFQRLGCMWVGTDVCRVCHQLLADAFQADMLEFRNPFSPCVSNPNNLQKSSLTYSGIR